MRLLNLVTSSRQTSSGTAGGNWVSGRDEVSGGRSGVEGVREGGVEGRVEGGRSGRREWREEEGKWIRSI